MKMPCKLFAATMVSLGAATFVAPAGAAAITAPSSLRAAAAPSVEAVQWRRDWRGWGWRPGVIAGAIVGGAIAAAQPWNWGYYDAYAYAPGYYGGYAPGYAYAPGYTYAPGNAYGDYAYAPGPSYSVGYSGGDAANCSQRFRSYDPGSGTYLGYDGMRHPCP